MIPSVNTGGCGVEPQTAATGGTRFNCTVAGVVAGSVLYRVNVNFTHTFTGDLDMFLVSPAGAVLELSTDNGGGGDNFTNTVFRDNALINITAGIPPFSGPFRPEGTLTATTCGITVTPTVTTLLAMGTTTGTWQLLILDDVGADAGAMINWSLTFVNSLSKDVDGDGYTDGVTTMSFPPPPGYDIVALTGDCNDNDPAINPGATEICEDNVDNNCNGQVDEPGCVTPIPTLGTWAVWSLMILLAISGVAFLRSRVITFSNPSKS